MPSRSFRNRLIAIFLILAIVPLALTAGLVGWHSYATHIEDTRARQLQRAESVVLQLAAFLRRAEQELKLTIRLAGGGASPGTVRPLLERLLADRATYREIALLDPRGVESLRLSNVQLVSAAAVPAPMAPARMASLARGETHIDPIRFDSVNGEPLMVVSVPVLSPRTGALTGVLVAELRARTVWELIGQQHVANGESAYIIEDAGYVIAHRNPSLVLGGRRAAFIPGGGWQDGLEGGRVLAVGAATDFGARTFTVVVERTFASAVAPAVDAVQLIGIVTIFTLGVALALFAVAVRSVVLPIQEITSVAMAVRDGEYDRRVEIDSRDEIGQLADSFNSMTARLRRVLGDLQVEVDERRQAEAQLLKVNKAYQALSAATALLDRADDETWILEKVCRIVINDCGYRLVWIGFIEDRGPAGHIRPGAHAGFDNGYLDLLDIDLSDPVRGQGPTAVCVRERRPVVVRDIATDPSFAPWRDEALMRGYAAAAAIPLMADGQVLGLLAVYAGQIGAMSDEEIRLLGELAANLAQGMMSLRLRQQRAQAEEDLRASEARLRQVTNAVPALVWMLGKDGATYFNQRYYDYTGLTEAELVEYGWQKCVHPDDLPAVVEKWRETLASGARIEIENRIRRADGAYRWFLVQGEPILAADGSRVWFGTCTDIEDRKRSELQLIQASKLATLGEMAAGMAHELGQPLNIIRITSDDAAARKAGDADGGDGRAFRVIAEQAARMGQIIEHMRVFSRDDNLQQEVFDAGPVIQSTAGLIGTQLAAHGIALRVGLPPGPVAVLGNRIQLEQVVLNLLANARDAIEGAAPGPLGTVRGRIEVSVAQDDGMVTISVSDDGPGIPDQILPHIFEPFFTTKPSGQGTGLGLAISQRIVQRMGGAMEARNRSRGAEFRLTLPVAALPLPVPAAPPVAAPAAPAAGQRLLVVDDESMAAELLEDILLRKGYHVTVAHDAAQAMADFTALRPDLVITDITMPRGDGVTLVARMRDSRPDLPVIFMTGRLDAASLLAAELQAGRTRLLRKPVAIDELVRNTMDMLARS